MLDGEDSRYLADIASYASEANLSLLKQAVTAMPSRVTAYKGWGRSWCRRSFRCEKRAQGEQETDGV